MALGISILNMEISCSESSGVYDVDDYGATAGCPRTGSTSGATDDSDAIEAALTAAPEGSIVRFTPGKVYMVTRAITVTGKSLTIEAHGAVIRCGDDTVWHVFMLGGESAMAKVDAVRWFGGVLDGNLANQRYYPNTDGTTIFTDEGTELLASHTGTPFYENSPVNGTAWDAGWTTGTAGDGIDVNGGGNDGLIRIKHAELAVYQDIECRDFVRNGVVTWDTVEVQAHQIRGFGQLPTTYSELGALHGQTHECALMKFSGTNNSEIINGQYSQRVHVTDCYSEGGAMPLFIRTNPPKPPASGIIALVERCQFYGVAREAWFEVCQSLNISNCHITGADYPDSTYRQDSAIFIGSGTQDWTIDNTYVYGRVNTNTPQAVRTGNFKNSVLINYSGNTKRCLECKTVDGSFIESRSGGVLADNILNSELYLSDEFGGSESLKVKSKISGCTVGKERFVATRERVTVAEDTNTATLSGSPDVVVRVLACQRSYQEGRWFEIHASDYDVSGNIVTFSDGSNLDAKGGDLELEVEWYSDIDDAIATTASLETSYTLTSFGGARKSDFTFVRYDGIDIPHIHDTTSPASDPRWSSEMNAAGYMVITLANVTVVDGQEFTVRYKPPLAPYRSLDLGPNDTHVDIVGTNFKGITSDGGRNYISGHYSDVSAPAFVLFADDTDLVEIKNANIERLSGGLICGENSTFSCEYGRILNNNISDWMLAFPRLDSDGYIARDRAIGCVRSNGSKFLRGFQFTGNTMEFTGKETGASKDAGRNQGGVLVNGTAIVGGNAYLGNVISPVVAIGTGSTKQTLPDFA